VSVRERAEHLITLADEVGRLIVADGQINDIGYGYEHSFGCTNCLEALNDRTASGMSAEP
jgi:hypothetical protein